MACLGTTVPRHFTGTDYLPELSSSPSGSSFYGTASSSSIAELSEAEIDQDQFILVTGGLGGVGSHTTWELLKSGKNVVVIDDLSSSNCATLEALIRLRDDYYQGGPCSPALDFYRLDYRDTNQVRNILTVYEDFTSSYVLSTSPLRSRITGVIHLAACKTTEQSCKNPLAYYSQNVSGLLDFCGVLAEFKIKKLVFSFSSAGHEELLVDGQDSPSLFHGQLNASMERLASKSLIIQTKLLCEKLLNDLALLDPSWTIIVSRYGQAFGSEVFNFPGEGSATFADHIMSEKVLAALGSHPSPVMHFGDSTSLESLAINSSRASGFSTATYPDLTHVSDLAQGNVAAMRIMRNNAQLPSGCHIQRVLGTRRDHSIDEIAGTLERLSEKALSIDEELPERFSVDTGLRIAVQPTSVSPSALKRGSRHSFQAACARVCRRLKSGPA